MSMPPETRSVEKSTLFGRHSKSVIVQLDSLFEIENLRYKSRDTKLILTGIELYIEVDANINTIKN